MEKFCQRIEVGLKIKDLSEKLSLIETQAQSVDTYQDETLSSVKMKRNETKINDVRRNEIRNREKYLS